MSETYSILSFTFYDNKQDMYIKSFSLDRMPSASEPIYRIVKKIVLPKLSPFQQQDERSRSQCGNIIMNPHNLFDYSRTDDLPILLTWLMHNGYVVDTSITKMINQGDVRMKSPIVCFIHR